MRFYKPTFALMWVEIEVIIMSPPLSGGLSFSVQKRLHGLITSSKNMFNDVIKLRLWILHCLEVVEGLA